MTIEQALADYVENSKVFEKPEPCEPAWLTEIRNPSPHRAELEKQLKKIIEEKEPRFLDKEENTLLTAGSFGVALSISHLMYWLGMRASQIDINEAVSELDNWFNKKKVDASYAVIALGPKIKIPIKVNNKITLYPTDLCPDPNLLSDLPLDNSGLAVFRSDASLVKTPVIIAWEEVQIPRLYGDDKPDILGMHQTFEIMEDAIRMVSLTNSMHYYIHRRTCELREYEPFSNLGKSNSGAKSDAFFADWRTNHSLDVQPESNTENYQEVFDEIWQKWEQCNKELKAKIRLAVDRWSQSQHRGSDEDKAIEMRIALEALLIGKEQGKISSTISHKVKLICPDNEDAPKLVSDIYNAGSRIMHEGRISDNFEKRSKSKQSLRRLLRTIHRSFPQMVCFVIENGIPTLPDRTGWKEKFTRLIYRTIQR